MLPITNVETSEARVKRAPFIVFSLPRSQSFWLSQFLTRPDGVACTHDLALDCASPADFRILLSRLPGTVETGAALYWRQLLEAFQDARVAVLRNNAAKVTRSLTQSGFEFDISDLMERAQALDELSAQPGVVTVTPSDLDDPQRALSLYRHLVGMAPLDGWYDFLRPQRLEIDVRARQALLASRASRLRGLRDQLEGYHVPSHGTIEVSPASWTAIWPDAKSLAHDHAAEIHGDGPHGEPDAELFASLDAAGLLRIFGARIDDNLIGYMVWAVGPDEERKGVRRVEMGPWYVSPSAPKRTAKMLFDVATKALSAESPDYLRLHAPTSGRGASLGRFFERMGAKPTMTIYDLTLGGKNGVH